MRMRKELKWYYERDEEVILVGTYRWYNKGFMFFTELTNLNTEDITKDLHVKENETIIRCNLKYGKPYILRGYVVKYTRIDKTEDYRLDDVIIEEI